MVNWLVAFGFALSVFGCGEPTIDSSTDESLKTSVSKIREQIPESEREQFDAALQVVSFSQMEISDLFAEGIAGTGTLKAKMRQSLHGKTGSEILVAAERIAVERQAREREQAAVEIRELEAKLERSVDARDQLRKFEVLRSRFYKREQQFLGEQPVIELTVRNGTEYAISRTFFEGTIASPDRSVPWHIDEFNYSISGGLEPGEEATWTLAPNMFSDWGKVKAPDDAVFTVTVERLDGPDGNAIIDGGEFSEDDRERLDALREQYRAAGQMR